MYTNNDYILFMAQEANFQTRSILIPIVEFLKVRNDDYEILKKASKPKTFLIDNQEYTVKNLLIQYFEPDKKYCNNGYSQLTSEYSLICNHLTHYADGMDKGCYFKMKDAIWYDKSIGNLCRGFDHVYNYKYILEHSDKNIVDSFLVFEEDI